MRTTPLEECKKRTDGMTLLLAELQRPEVDIRPYPKSDATPWRRARFATTTCPWPCPIGSVKRVEGFRYLLDGLNPKRILVASEALGIGKVAISKAVAYAKQRQVFGRPIGMNQGVAFPLAEAHARLHTAELVIREASWRYDQGLPCAEQANMAKWLAADAGHFAADRAMQTFGGFGYAKEYDVSSDTGSSRASWRSRRYPRK